MRCAASRRQAGAGEAFRSASPMPSRSSPRRAAMADAAATMIANAVDLPGHPAGPARPGARPPARQRSRQSFLVTRAVGAAFGAARSPPPWLSGVARADGSTAAASSTSCCIWRRKPHSRADLEPHVPCGAPPMPDVASASFSSPLRRSSMRAGRAADGRCAGPRCSR